MGREQSLKLAITVSSGSGTGTTTKAWDLIRWLRVVPTTESDTYTVTLKDADGYIILKRTSQVGTFSERVEISLGILNTIDISGASADGTYNCRLDMS